MATTTPDNIWTPDSGDDYALTTDLAAMADTIQDAISARADLRRTTSDLSAYTPETGTLVWLTDRHALIVRVGGSWRLAAPLISTEFASTSGGVANGTNLVTMTFPALPFATNVWLDAAAQVGNTSVSAGTYAPSFSTSAGTLTEQPQTLYSCPSGEWRSVPRQARLQLAAGVGATVTVRSSSTQNGRWYVALNATRRSGTT